MLSHLAALDDIGAERRRSVANQPTVVNDNRLRRNDRGAGIAIAAVRWLTDLQSCASKK
jgi:hypothetical protein